MQKILIAPHQALRKQAKTLDKVTKVDVEISKQMIQTMKNGFGAGLSANQIGILKKIITVHVRDEEQIKQLEQYAKQQKRIQKRRRKPYFK